MDLLCNFLNLIQSVLHDLSNHIEVKNYVYIFPDVPDARATHTPTLLHIVPVEKMFEPKIDNKHTDYIWSDTLPDEMLKQTVWL